MLKHFRVFAFTHKTLPLEQVGKFHIEQEVLQSRLKSAKDILGLSELMYLSTCNRVEFLFVVNADAPPVSPIDFIKVLNIDIPEDKWLSVAQGAEVFAADDAVKHLFKVSASLDSMVIGEREIITQVRKSFEDCQEMGLTGDFIRLVVKKTIETAKQVFTETAIFKKPVSVVSLAFHRLRDLDVPSTSRILMIGAGRTNRAMAKFLSKHGYKNITIYNRSIERAESLAKEVGARAGVLTQLENYKEGFDVLVTCTGASNSIVGAGLYNSLLNGDESRKIIIDLAIPGDLAPEVIEEHGKNIRYIDISQLKITADKNLAERSTEISRCEEIIDHNLLEFHDIYKQREIELAMSEIPRKVKEIKDMALTAVYAKEVNALNPESREVLDKVIAYLEKKYISVPMKMAREVMLNKSK